MTAANSEAVRHYDDFAIRFLAHGSDSPEPLKLAMDADPDLLLGHCARGFCSMILGRNELKAAARGSLAEARRSLKLRGGTSRERAYVDALAAFCDGWFHQAADILAESLRSAPLDGYGAKLVHAIRFMVGDADGMRQATTAILPAWRDDVRGTGYILGCHAFGLTETGEHTEAERVGRRALELAHDDAWAFHAVAHVFEARDQSTAGIAWLDSDAADISDTGNLAYHIAWHKAIVLLDFKDYERIFHIYDEQIRGQKTDDFRDLTNGVSMLLRLRFAGVDVGDRWNELIEKISNRADDTALGFAALHYLSALAENERWDDALRMLKAIRIAAGDDGDQALVFRNVGLPFAESYYALIRGEHDLEETARLADCIPDLAMVGGSHAQRDVFVRIVADRLAACGDIARLRKLLTDRLDMRPQNVWATDMLSGLSNDDGYATDNRKTVPQAAE